MAWSVKFVIWVLTITWTYATQLPEPKNCTVKEHLPCLLYEPSDCRPENLQTLFPNIYNDTFMFPGQAGSFNGEIGYIKYSNNNSFPEVYLTFTPTPGAAMFYTKGFEVMQLKGDNPTPKCFIFDLGNAKWKNSDLGTVFNLTRGPLEPGKLHYYELYALPKPFVEYDVYRNVQVNPRAIMASDTPIRWAASINIDFYPAEKRILVQFYPPPVKYGFDSYNVKLYNDDTGAIPDKFDQIHETYLNFTNIKPGNYSVWVQPHDPDWNAADITKCLCHKKVCEPCATTKTTVFEMQYVEEDTTTSITTKPPSVPSSKPTSASALVMTSPSDASVDNVKIVMAVLGSVLGMALVAVAALVYMKKCRRSEEDEMKDQHKPYYGQDLNENFDKNNPGFDFDGSLVTVDDFKNRNRPVNNANANKTKFLKKPKLFLLFEDDHEYHRKVVDNFALYLQQHCQCVVMCVEWQMDASWAHQELEQADYIIIVNSEGAYKSYVTKYDRKVNGGGSGSRSGSGSRATSINSIRNKFLADEHYDNTVMVYFDYTDENFILPDICPGYKYKLMKHFNDFLLHIHKLQRTDNLSQYDLPFDGNHNLRPTGIELTDAITQAIRYERENPKWSLKRFGMFRSCSHASDESQLDSGLPDDPNSPTATPVVEKSEPWHMDDPTQRHLMAYLENASQDAVTINPSDIDFTSRKEPVHYDNPPQTAGKSHYQGLKLNPACFDKHIYNELSHYPPTPPTAGSDESGYDFLPPDEEDDFDVMSKTQSEQMKNIVDRYHYNTNNNGYPRNHYHGNQNGGYDQRADLDVLNNGVGDIVFQDGEVISLGGESV